MNNKGYTLIELIVVTIIISILSLIIIPSYNAYINKTKETVIKSKMYNVIEITNNYIKDLKTGKLSFKIMEFKYSNSLKKLYIIRNESIKEYFDTFPLFNEEQDIFIGIKVTWKNANDVTTYKFEIIDIFYIIEKNHWIRYYNKEYIDYNDRKNIKEKEDVYNFLKDYTIYEKYNSV